jgi:hypothetical protein
VLGPPTAYKTGTIDLKYAKAIIAHTVPIAEPTTVSPNQ